MSRQSRFRAALACLVVVVAGCTSAASPSTVPADPSASPAAPLSRTLPPTPGPTPVSLYDESADARAAILSALAEAKRDGKRVLVDFGADWCPDCHALAAYLDSPRGRQLIESSFVVVSVDVGYWDHNLDVVKDYGDAIWNGIPALVALEPDGAIVGSSADGSLASAGGMTESEVLNYIERWVP